MTEVTIASEEILLCPVDRIARGPTRHNDELLEKEETVNRGGKPGSVPASKTSASIRATR
jgi:hypothetical protein